MKKTLFFVLALSAFGTSQAVQITESQALRTASEYFADRAFSSLSAVKLKSQTNDEAPYYAFNSDNGGFVIVSGDNELTPIVGYSDSGRFDADNIPEAYAKGYKKLKIPASGSMIPDKDLSALQLSMDTE